MHNKIKDAVAAVGFSLMLAVSLPGQAQSTADADPWLIANFAEDIGVSTAEAKRRLYLQGLAGELQGQVASIAPEIFAGLYIEHAPEFRVVVMTTGDGRSLVTPLLTGRLTPLSTVVEVRRVARSMRELEALLDQSANLVAALGLDASFDIDIKSNSVVIIPADPGELKTSLSAAKRSFPDGARIAKGRPAKKLSP